MRWYRHILALAALWLLLLLGWGLDRESAVVTADEAPPAWTTAVTPKPLSARSRRDWRGWSSTRLPAAAGARVKSRRRWVAARVPRQARRRRHLHRRAGRAIRKHAARVRTRTPSPTPSASSAAGRSLRREVAQRQLHPGNAGADEARAEHRHVPRVVVAGRGQGPDAGRPANAAVDLALNKVLDKIKKNQKADGTWDNQHGWAPSSRNRSGVKV